MRGRSWLILAGLLLWNEDMIDETAEQFIDIAKGLDTLAVAFATGFGAVRRFYHYRMKA